MAISRSQLLNQLIPGLYEVAGMAYTQYTNEHEPLFDIHTSGRSFEEEVLMTGFGEAPIKSEGTGVAYDDAEEAWKSRYDMETVALAYALTEEAMEDELYGTTGRLQSEALGRSLASTKQQKAADVWNFGFDSSRPGGDGQPLFSDDHPLVNGGTLSNADNSDLSETSLENAIIAISEFVDDRGILINCQPMSLHIPTNLQFTAFKILKSDKTTTIGVNPNSTSNGATNQNEVNAIYQGGFFPNGMHINHRFSDSGGWFIRTDCPNVTKMFVRKPLSFATEGDFDTGNLRVNGRERYAFGWTDPRGAFGSSSTNGPA